MKFLSLFLILLFAIAPLPLPPHSSLTHVAPKLIPNITLNSAIDKMETARAAGTAATAIHTAATATVEARTRVSSINIYKTSEAGGSFQTFALLSGEPVLYSDSLLTRPVTSLPSSYFVIVLDESPLYFHVSYLDLVGFIPKNVATIVDYEPVSKFASPTFTVQNDGYPATLRAQPDHLSDNRVLEIPSGASGVYYGKSIGSAMIGEVGNLWYYLKFNDGQTDYYGYVYKTQITVDEIAENIIEKVKRTDENNSPASPFEITSLESVLLILALSLPVVFIMLTIFSKKRSGPRFSK